jgi:N utilization substance protein B
MDRFSLKSKHGSRRKSREIALSLLYSLEFTGLSDVERKREDTFDLIDISEADDAYAAHLFEGVCRDMDGIDGRIRAFSHHWRLERMNLIDRNIIRLGVFEILERLVPVEVVINEAVEISKIYGDSKSASFVNGILDAVAKQVKETT